MHKIITMGLSVSAALVINISLALGMEEDDRRPVEHICPITMSVMTDPVVAADGHSYERKAIQRHFEVNGDTSPLTRERLAARNLFDNHALKVMIKEWKPGRKSDPSELDTQEARSIAERVRQEFRKNASLLNAAKDQHIVAFLGNTGSGKSTLVNLLAGKKLVPSKDGEDYVLADPQDPTAMVIGTTGKSETLYPKFIDVDKLRFFDLPGFNDTDGSERNLVNAAFTRKILLDAASVRLVFVVGQDQFTADRSASVKNMFQSIKQLFVADHGMSLIDKGVFVATKITCTPETNIIDFLLKKTEARDKEDLNQQLQFWNQKKKISRMFHPIRGFDEGIRADIRGRVQETEPTKIRGLNVSALYPSETKNALERMFMSVMEATLTDNISAPLPSLSDYDRALSRYSAKDFWQRFEETLCHQEEAIGLLKEFCIIPYTKALRRVEREREGKRQDYLKSLRKKRQELVDDIGRRTELMARKVVSSFVPQKTQQGPQQDDFVFFDFAYHKDYYDQVCGASSIHHLATDPEEQEVVRQQYADFIARHSHEQMIRWQQKFSGVSELTKRLTLVEEELKKLKASTAEKELILQRPLPPPLPIKVSISIPEVARGYEDIYERFLKGVLVYRPNEGSDVGKIELPIAALSNPLGSTFDLSSCGDTGKYLSISTGYRKEKIAANANKLEIWLTPRFLVNKEMPHLAPNHHIRAISGKWDAARAPIGIFWTWGGWNAADHMSYGDYLTTESLAELGSESLYGKYFKRHGGTGEYSITRHQMPLWITFGL